MCKRLIYLFVDNARYWRIKGEAALDPLGAIGSSRALAAHHFPAPCQRTA
jgi:hypothetical protein